MSEIFMDGFVYRWLHIFFGIIWIGILYYFNFVQTPFMGEMQEAPVKSGVTRVLVPRALWWFRWGAMFTFLTGLALIYIKYVDAMKSGVFLTSAGGMTITFGALLGTLMFLNVWLIIWPNQKVVIANAKATAEGKPADPKAAGSAARAGVASRTNTLFSIPMLFFMVASGHYPYVGNKESGAFAAVFYGLLLLILLIELNAIKGKLIGPLKTVKGVISGGFGLWLILYVATRFISNLG